MFRKKITTELSLYSIKSRLLESDKFTGEFDDRNFTLKENLFFHNRALHPIINGFIIEQGDKTLVEIDFKLLKFDKISFLVYMIMCLLVLVVCSIYYNNIEFFFVILSGVFMIFLISFICYMIICFKVKFKLSRLLRKKVFKFI